MSPYVLAVIRAQIVPCSETTLTGESRFHISPPRGIWTWVLCDRKQTGSPLDQWDMVRMKWDCRVSTPHKKIQTISVIFYSRRDNMSSWNGAQKPVLGRVWPIARYKSRWPLKSNRRFDDVLWSLSMKKKYCLVERGDGSYDSTSLFLYIRQLL